MIGFVEIERIIRFDNLDGKELQRTLEPYKQNAHALAWFKLHSIPKWSKMWDFENHRIFVGTGNSRRFERAVPFDWKIAAKILRRPRRYGYKKLKRNGGTALSRIGSYTRTVRLIEGPRAKERKRILREHLKALAGCDLHI